MAQDWNGRHVVLTGAASGIGHETALRLLEAGARITAVDRNAVDAPVHASIQVDLSDAAAVEALPGRIDGPIDALINVAGVPGTASAEVVMSVNLFALKRLTELLVDRIPVGGSVTHVASIAGANWMADLAEIDELLDTLDAGGFPGGLAWIDEHRRSGTESYDFSKECVIVLTKRQARWLKERGVRVNSVSPGVVDTPILVDFVESMGTDRIGFAESIAGRHSAPAEQAAAIVAIADPALGWVNGCDLVCDGGTMSSIVGRWAF